MTNLEASQLDDLLKKLAQEGRQARDVFEANKTLSHTELHTAVALLEDLY
jgi:hypothetical protein